MAVDRWFLGGGVEHTPESARRLLYTATGGTEGIASPGDLAVRPLNVPGGGVRILPGNANILSRYVGSSNQMYMGSVTTEETIAIPATGSGAGRTDLIIMRVEDPFAAGSPYPEPPEAQIPNYPGVYIRVVSGVGANVTRVQQVAGRENDTAITLARITIPASTGTISAGMITDLRRVQTVLPTVDDRVFYTRDETGNTTLTSTTETFFPNFGVPVYIPEDAVGANIRIDVGGVIIPSSSTANGTFRGWLSSARGSVWTASGAFRGLGAPNQYRETWTKGDRIDIPASMRGLHGTFHIMSKLSSAVATDRAPHLNTTSSTIVDIQFFRAGDYYS